MATFELFHDKNKDLAFRLKAANGTILLTSEGYASRAEVEEGILLAQKLAPNAMNFERKRVGQEHTFMLQTYEGDVVAAGGIYPSTAARDKGIEAVKRAAPDAEVIEPA